MELGSAGGHKLARLHRQRLLETHPRLKGRVEHSQPTHERGWLHPVRVEKITELLRRQRRRAAACPDEALVLRLQREQRVVEDLPIVHLLELLQGKNNQQAFYLAQMEQK